MAHWNPTVQRIVESTLKNRGGTFNARTGRPVKPSSGYAVAVENLGTGNGALLSERYLGDRVSEALVYQRDIPYIGTWVDRNRFGNDVCYVDRVVILPDRESALILARALGEQAVYDFATGESVRVTRKAA